MDTRRQYDHRKNMGISFHYFIDICVRKFWIFILWGLLMGVLGFALAKYVVTPQYLATSEILVNKPIVKVLRRLSIISRLTYR